MKIEDIEQWEKEHPDSSPCDKDGCAMSFKTDYKDTAEKIRQARDRGERPVDLFCEACAKIYGEKFWDLAPAKWVKN